jgi:putative FmdB family regulatory protein
MVYEFKCTSEKCGNVFDDVMSVEDYEKYGDGTVCPKCTAKARRVWGKTPVKFNFANTMGKRYLT